MEVSNDLVFVIALHFRSDHLQGICAGKHSVARYLVEHHSFSQLHLQRNDLIGTPAASPANPSTNGASFSPDIDRLNLVSDRKDVYFRTAQALLDFVTREWQRRWVTADMWDESVLECLVRRPFFLLVSIDAPISVRWRRYKERCFYHSRIFLRVLITYCYLQVWRAIANT